MFAKDEHSPAPEETKNCSYAQTIGVDFFEKRISLRGDRAVRLQIWDVGGRQRPTYSTRFKEFRIEF